MNMEIADKSSITEAVTQILPPEVKFSTATATFSGVATPGLTIRLTSSIDGQAYSVTVDKDGAWEIPLGKQPHWYTVFNIWAQDCAGGGESVKVQFTFGGKNPVLNEVYIGETAAHGSATKGSDVFIYTESGQLIGCANADVDTGGWSVKFYHKPEAGDVICVMAKLRSGNTSMPHFTTAHKFSITRTSVGKIEGTGALPGDIIQLFDAESNALIEGVDAKDDGSWSFRLKNWLEPATRIRFDRVHADGTSSTGPTIFSVSGDLLSPVILGMDDWTIWGVGIQNTEVELKIYNGSAQPISSNQPNATVDANSNWTMSLSKAAVQNYYYKVTGWDESNGSYSKDYSCVQYQRAIPRPATPYIQYESGGVFRVWSEPDSFVGMASKDDGHLCNQQVEYDGHVDLPSVTSLGVPDSSSELFVFGAFMQYGKGAYVTPTSSYAAQNGGDTTDDTPPAPTMNQYDGNTFAGNETYIPSVVNVFCPTLGGVTINRPSIPVHNDTSWTSDDVTVDNENPGGSTKIPIGATVFAQATSKDGGDLGSTSDNSPDYVVGPTVGFKVPPPPEVLDNRFNGISGQTFANTMVTAHYIDLDNQEHFVETVYATGTDWQMLVKQDEGPGEGGVPNGCVFKVTAQFFDQSNPSDVFSSQVGTYVEQPSLTGVGTYSCSGSVETGNAWIDGWRSSDGEHIFHYYVTQPTDQDGVPLPGPINFTQIPYMNGAELAEGDHLNIVKRIGDQNTGPMSTFNRHQEGYGSGS